jgi:hypothetical protein
MSIATTVKLQAENEELRFQIIALKAPILTSEPNSTSCFLFPHEYGQRFPVLFDLLLAHHPTLPRWRAPW